MIPTTVVAFPANFEAWIEAGMNSFTTQSVDVAGDGSFALSYLVPGDYLVVALTRVPRLNFDNPDVIRAAARVATRVTVRPGDNRVAKTLAVYTITF